MEKGTAESPALLRAMGRWTLAALVVNSILGSGIFGLPSVIGRLLGPAAPWAWLVGAAGNGLVMLCFAEVASRFRGAGGPYLYARAALPRLLAIQVGWLAFLTRLSAAAAGTNLFTVNLAEFWPAADGRWLRNALMTALLATLALVNYRGVRGGARLSNLFTVGKLLPLAILLAAGALFLARQEGAQPAPAAGAGLGEWLRASLLIAFAYGGYDGAMLAMGEAREPRRDAPFALIGAMLFLAALYTAVQIVVDSTLVSTASERPLVDAARVVIGPLGGALLAAGALVSVIGFLVANFLNAPRLSFALAEHGDAPAVFQRVHATFRTPHVSILVFAVSVWVLALYGNFEWNAMLSAVARLFVYGSTCVALLVLRRRDPRGARLRLPGGALFAILGIALCALLASRMGQKEIVVLGAVGAVALAHWFLVRRHPRSAGDDREA
jgi:amino acid transporter